MKTSPIIDVFLSLLFALHTKRIISAIQAFVREWTAGGRMTITKTIAFVAKIDTIANWNRFSEKSMNEMKSDSSK